MSIIRPGRLLSLPVIWNILITHADHFLNLTYSDFGTVRRKLTRSSHFFANKNPLKATPSCARARIFHFNLAPYLRPVLCLFLSVEHNYIDLGTPCSQSLYIISVYGDQSMPLYTWEICTNHGSSLFHFWIIHQLIISVDKYCNRSLRGL